jgi:outer membrane lipoprotein-sorting protein
MKRMTTICLSATLLLITVAGGPPVEGAADDEVVMRLLEKADDMMRGESSEGRMSMHVKTSRWDRTLSMNVWSQGTDKSLVIITDPPKERGMATLKVDKNIWNYLPKVDRTIKVPASMMSGSWMGSHFTNDDIVKDARYSRDFDNKLLESPEDNDQGLYIIESIPKPDTPVVWGKIIIKIRASDELLDEVTFYDEQDQLMRTMLFEDIGDLGGRRLPRRTKTIPADKPDEFTEMIYEELTFDVNLPERTFTLQALRR